MSKVIGSYLISRTLKEEGVDTLFYLMGGPNFDIVMAAEDQGIRCIDFRHEQAAAFAAHAYARVTGKPGVCTAASGPGTLNLLTGVYTAAIDCAPMVISGRRGAGSRDRARGVPGGGSGRHHGADDEVGSPDDAGGALPRSRQHGVPQGYDGTARPGVY